LDAQDLEVLGESGWTVADGRFRPTPRPVAD